MPVDRGSHVTRRYAPYGSSAGVRHRGPKALQRYGTRVGSAKKGWKRRKNATLVVPRSKLAFPQGMRTKLRYVQHLEFEPSNSATIDFNSWRANSMTDPGITLTTNHQPRGFDDFLDIYNSYTVLASKITVTFMYKQYDGVAAEESTSGSGGEYMIKTVQNVTTDGASAGAAPVVCGIRKGMTSAGAVTSSDIMEQERSVWRFMTPQEGSVTVSQSMHVSDFYGKGSLVGAEGYTGTKIADADNIVVYDVWCGRANNNTAGVCKVAAYLMIEYDVQFNEPKALQAS